MYMDSDLPGLIFKQMKDVLIQIVIESHTDPGQSCLDLPLEWWVNVGMKICECSANS